MIRSEVEAMLDKEKEKAFAFMIDLDLKPPYPTEIVMKAYTIGYVAPQFKIINSRRGNTRDHIVHFLGLPEAHCKH